MYIQEVFKSIYNKHLYEYFIINREFEIVSHSDRVYKYCDEESFEDSDIFEAIPELIGMEDEMIELLDRDNDRIDLPIIFKEPNNYITISITPDTEYNNIIILFEDVTTITNAQQSSLQDRNQKTLLLAELADKNLQLENFNRDIQVLVQEEISKNVENQKLIKLQARHAQMGEIIGMITHQWKQPLSAINVNCGYLQLKYNNGTLTKDIFDNKMKSILAQSEHLHQTILDFQNFFNPSKRKKKFNIMHSINSILGLVKSDYHIKNISIVVKGEDNIEVEGYENEYNQVILSLIQNAKDEFLSNTKEDMKIEISIDSLSGVSIVKVKDNAGGIPEHIIDTIFDVYMTTKKEGSGLGLHISKSVMEDMGGILSVSNIKNGAEFSIVL